MVVPFGLGSIANLVADCLSMVSILGAPHNGAILPETMLRTHAAFEGVGAAYSISLDCAFLRGGVNPLGTETMLSRLAAFGGLVQPLYTSGSVFAKHGFLFLLD